MGAQNINELMTIADVDREVSRYITEKPNPARGHFSFFRWRYTELSHEYDEFSCGIKEIFEDQIWAVFVKDRSSVIYIQLFDNLEDVKNDYYIQLKKYHFIKQK